jgi:hypothetical protein
MGAGMRAKLDVGLVKYHHDTEIKQARQMSSAKQVSSGIVRRCKEYQRPVRALALCSGTQRLDVHIETR